MTTQFAHRTSIPFKELIESQSLSESDIKDGICSQRLVPSYFISGEVREYYIDSSGVWRQTKSAFKNELMFLIQPKLTGLLDCEFQFCAPAANAVQAGLPMFKLGPPGMDQERVSIADILEKGSVINSELLRFQADCLSLQNAQPRSTSSHWPWGAHHTVLLGHLEAAAKRYWVDYDPALPGSANTNDTVIDWLKSELKVSDRMASAIATMLRPDGLAPGPR